MPRDKKKLDIPLKKALICCFCLFSTFNPHPDWGVASLLFNMSVLDCSLQAAWHSVQNNDVNFLIVATPYKLENIGAAFSNLHGTNPCDDTDNTCTVQYSIVYSLILYVYSGLTDGLRQNRAIHEDKKKSLAWSHLWPMNCYSYFNSKKMTFSLKFSHVSFKDAHTLWPFLSLMSESGQKTLCFRARLCQIISLRYFPMYKINSSICMYVLHIRIPLDKETVWPWNMNFILWGLVLRQNVFFSCKIFTCDLSQMFGWVRWSSSVRLYLRHSGALS